MKKELKNNIKRWAITAAKITAVAVVLLIVGYFCFRNMVLHKVIARIQEKTQTEYNSTFTVAASTFRGIGGVDLTDVTLKPNNADTLFRIHTIKTDINLLKLLVGDIQLENLELNDGFVQLVKKDSIKNFDAFIKNKKDTLEVEVVFK